MALRYTRATGRGGGGVSCKYKANNMTIVGSFLCKQENKITDKAMSIVFGIENEACLSGKRGPRGLKGKE